MKIIALGDTHGRYNWKSIVAKETFDKVIFIGDYFDTHESNVSGNQQLENFKDIMEFKKQNTDKVVLLFGNHDFHYLSVARFQYSGFQPAFKLSFQEQLHKAIDKGFLQMCFKYNGFLFSHAGVTKTWCANNNINLNNIDNSINDLFQFKPNKFEFTAGPERNNYGDEVCQTPIWVRSRSLYMDKVDGYIQVVGHTTQDVISGISGSRMVFTHGRMIETSGVIFIDTLGTSGEYLCIENNIATAKK